jgi:hypothetical protein
LPKNELVSNAKTDLHQFELSNMLCKVLEGSHLLLSPNEQWLADRRTLDHHFKHMYRRVNLRRFKFAEDFVVNDWATNDDQSEGESSGELELDNEMVSAVNGFELYHWNRMVARDDFNNRRGLGAERERAYLSAMPLPDPIAW